MRHFGKIDGIPVAITDHALERMAEMDVKAVEFHALITNPDEVYRSKKYPDAVCHRKGKYSIALNKEPNLTTVITVLYGSLEAMTYDTYELDKERAEKAPEARNDILAKRFGRQAQRTRSEDQDR